MIQPQVPDLAGYVQETVQDSAASVMSIDLLMSMDPFFVVTASDSQHKEEHQLHQPLACPWHQI
jgi:hypothetical protein